MEFILHDIILGVIDVDEAYEAHAKIQDKFILLSTPGDKFRNLDNDKSLFDFFKDDTYTNHSSEKVNTRFRVFSNNDPKQYQDYYANISSLDYLKLSWRFNKLWVQKSANIMWFMNLLVAILAIIASTYVTITLSQKNNSDKIEIVNPTKLDNKQLNEIIKAIQTSKYIKLDSAQVRQIIQQLKTKSKNTLSK